MSPEVALNTGGRFAGAMIDCVILDVNKNAVASEPSSRMQMRFVVE